MEFWKYLELLKNKQQGWFFKRDNLEQRLNALNKILELGYPSSIRDLIPFLKDSKREIQQATCDVIIQLFKNIKTKKDYYETLKYCDISKSDIDYFKQTFSSEQLLVVLAIATLNASGYVREKAIKALPQTNSEKAIPFIVYRLADWVQPVRQSALNALGNFKKPEFINSLVDNLSNFEWLQKVERIDLSFIYTDIMNFVVVENKQYVIANFKNFSDRTRLIIAKQLVKPENVVIDDLKLLLGDTHFLVRGFALMHFDKLTQLEIDGLLNDKSSRIRIQTLYKLKDNINFTKIVYPFLADNSASIRGLARYSLKEQNVDFIGIYNSNLQEKRYVIGSLSGLAETNGIQFRESINPFLTDRKIKVKKTAFLALVKLDAEQAYIFALQNLDNEHIGIRNLVTNFLSTSATTEVLENVREIYKNGGHDLKISMLKFFSKVGGWATIADIMIGTIDENENIRRLSLDYLQQWKNKATTYFILPKAGELERANRIFRYVSEMHDEKNFFKQNPLMGIDFYLQ